MKNYYPTVQLSSNMSEEERLHCSDKFGGLPRGLPDGAWPLCKMCGKPMSFLAQFKHHQDRLDLGKEGRVLFLFLCDRPAKLCPSWDVQKGANACFVKEHETLISEYAHPPEEGVPVAAEVFVVSWTEREDKISDENAGKFLVGSRYEELDGETLLKTCFHTRFGGVPGWIDAPGALPKGNWKFIGQISSHYDFQGQPPTEYIDGPNFGESGIAYIFLENKSLGIPKGCFFWQCY